MDMNYLYDRYKNLTDDELFDKIRQDFGPKAEEQLRTTGMLTLNDALKYRDVNKDNISITPIKD